MGPGALRPTGHRQLLVARAACRALSFWIINPLPEAIEALTGWFEAGKLKSNEHILEGAEAARDAIAMLYRGENTGKLLVRPD